MAGEHNERVYYFVIDRAHRGVSVAQWQNIGARNPKVWGSIPHRDSDFFSFVLRSWQEEKYLSLFMNLLVKSGLRDLNR